MPFTMSCPGLSGSAWWTLVLPLTLLSLAPQRALASSDGLNASTAVGGWGGLGSRQRVVKLLHGQRWEHYSQYTISQKSGSTADDGSTASESSTGLDLGCDTLWVYQPLDHFSEEEPKSYSWQQRVHVCTRFWGKGSSEPLFFYAGPEAAVEEAFPTIFSDWAQQDGGLLVYAEVCDLFCRFGGLPYISLHMPGLPSWHALCTKLGGELLTALPVSAWAAYLYYAKGVLAWPSHSTIHEQGAHPCLDFLLH